MLVMDEPVDLDDQGHVLGTIIPTSAASFHWTQNRELLFPVPQDVLPDIQRFCHFADRA